MTPDHTAGVFCTGGTWTQRQTRPKGRWHEDTGRQGHLQPARPARRSDRFQLRGPEEGPALQAPRSQTLPPGRERMHFCRPAPALRCLVTAPAGWGSRPSQGCAVFLPMARTYSRSQRTGASAVQLRGGAWSHSSVPGPLPAQAAHGASHRVGTHAGHLPGGNTLLSLNVPHCVWPQGEETPSAMRRNRNRPSSITEKAPGEASAECPRCWGGEPGLRHRRGPRAWRCPAKVAAVSARTLTPTATRM